MPTGSQAHCSSPCQRPLMQTYHRVSNPSPTQHQTRSHLLTYCRAILLFDQQQSILLDDRGTCVWTTCPETSCDSKQLGVEPSWSQDEWHNHYKPCHAVQKPQDNMQWRDRASCWPVQSVMQCQLCVSDQTSDCPSSCVAECIVTGLYTNCSTTPDTLTIQYKAT